jgi:uncharacterized membrane protein YtjA (UPF0391 family)
MLRWSLVFLIIALLAGLFGFTPVGGASYEAAKIMFFAFLVLFVVSLMFDPRTPQDIV